MRYVPDKICRENHNAFYVKYLIFLLKSCRFCDDVQKYCRTGQVTGDGIIRRMLITCWIPKARYTHSEYVIFIVSPLQQWLHERASMVRISALRVLSRLSAFDKAAVTFNERHREGTESEV